MRFFVILRMFINPIQLRFTVFYKFWIIGFFHFKSGLQGFVVFQKFARCIFENLRRIIFFLTENRIEEIPVKIRINRFRLQRF